MSGTTSAPRGLDGVVAAQTTLSHVDGKNGVLIIGGYELKELAGKVQAAERRNGELQTQIEGLLKQVDDMHNARSRGAHPQRACRATRRV